MAIKKRETDASQEEAPVTLQAGVSDAEAKEAKEASKEVADQEAPAFLPVDDDDGLAEPPEGAVVTNTDMSLVSNAAVNATSDFGAHVYGDEFTGQGGTFAIDPETGERKRVYEKYLNANGKERYRPVN